MRYGISDVFRQEMSRGPAMSSHEKFDCNESVPRDRLAVIRNNQIHVSCTTAVNHENAKPTDDGCEKLRTTKNSASSCHGR